MEALRGMVGGVSSTIRLNTTSNLIDAGLSHVMSYRPENLTDNPCILVQGDATKRDTLKRECADLIVTSPPYNVSKAYNGHAEADEKSYDDYLKFSKKWLRNCYFWTRPTGRLCVNVSIDKNRNGKVPLSADITKIAMDAGWYYHATIVWNEGNISRRTAWGSWKSASAPHIIAPVETIIVLYKGRWKRERQGTSDISGEEFKNWVLGVWNFNGESAKRVGHEAPFPRALPERCIKLLSFPGDTVLDPFSGSGTTLIEAVERGRNALGIELEKNYCNLIKRRIEKECRLKLEPSQQVKTGEIYTALLDGINSYSSAHEFVGSAYEMYRANYSNNPSVNGKVFELLICETLVRENVLPFYYQAQIYLVPNATFDIVCFNSRKPVVLSCKVSLRERYKQADLEGTVLRQVYRLAESYLLTLSDEQTGVQAKIEEGGIAGLTACIRADAEQYTRLLAKLSKREFVEASPIIPLCGSLFSVSKV